KGKKRREELCCEICEADHILDECPVFNGESGFFQIPTWGAKGVIPRSDGVTAFITVKEGSILGATQKVDMRYTRKMGVVRILVVVTDVNHIPESAEIVVGEGLYEIFFKVDKVLKDGRWIDNDITGNQDGDDKTEGENKDYSEKHDFDLAPTEEATEDTVMEDTSKQCDHTKSNDVAMDLELVVQQEYQDVITMEAATCLVSELLEIDEHAVLNSSLPVCSVLPGSKSNERNDVDPVVLCHAKHSTDELNQSLVNAISDQVLYCPAPSSSLVDTIRLGMTEDKLQNQHDARLLDEPEALKFNSITKRVKTDKINHGEFKLISKRTNTDEDILSKAQRMAAKRNLEISELSFIPFHSKIITSKCEKIGISLGTTENEVLQSVVSIKNIEIDRLTVAAKSTSPFTANTFNDEEDNVLDDELSHIAERWDEDSELCGLDQCCELTVAPRRKKANRNGK
ncbi:hypothetical protein ACJX0J_041863, partial [Zea mays]